ncbi:MAG: hypothetical protein WC609_02375 [Candidatus Paceibacterota bacterium]|jgi:hypothetical protein
MKIIEKNLGKLILILFVFFVPITFLFGQTGVCDPTTEICNPINANSIQDLISTILTGMIQVGLPIIALAIVYSGFLFVFAMGNPEKLKKAKEALLYTLIGGAVLLGSWAIAKMISGTIVGL